MAEQPKHYHPWALSSHAIRCARAKSMFDSYYEDKEYSKMKVTPFIKKHMQPEGYNGGGLLDSGYGYYYDGFYKWFVLPNNQDIKHQDFKKYDEIIKILSNSGMFHRDNMRFFGAFLSSQNSNQLLSFYFNDNSDTKEELTYDNINDKLESFLKYNLKGLWHKTSDKIIMRN